MQRTLEKLIQDRLDEQAKLREKIAEIARLAETLGRLQSRIETVPLPPDKKPFGRPLPPGQEDLRPLFAQTAAAVKALAEAAASLAERQDCLADARDKEWDALGNNHLGLLIQGLEWRVDRLAQASEDAAALLRTSASFKDQLGRLLAAVEEKSLPSPVSVR